MKKSWQETTANECRYGDIAGKIWGDWNILWEDSEADYQGHAAILAERDGKFSYYEWWYGSCSGCDDWEARDLSDEDVEKEMRDTAIWFADRSQLDAYLSRIEIKSKSFGDSMDDRLAWRAEALKAAVQGAAQ